MTTLKETATAYEPKRTLIVSDLPMISILEPTEERNDVDKNNKPYSYVVMVRDGVDYRVPSSVLEQIKNITEIDEKITEVQISKKGEGMDSKYTVIPVLSDK
jgi:hypothetical protein